MTGRDHPEAVDPLAFTVVVPVLDEERGVGPTLDAIERALADGPHPHEVVVVDDGSRDGTAAILASRTAIRVVTHAETHGYGAALKSGIAAARHGLVVVLDADGTYAAAAIPTLVEACSGADMVVGARIGKHVHSTPLRSAVKWLFRQFAQSITGAAIPDLNSGLRVFRRSLAARFADVLPDGFSFTTTITVASLLDGLTVRFEAIDYLPRIGRSKLRPVRDTWRIARQLLRLGIRRAPLRTSMWVVVPAVVLTGGLLEGSAGSHGVAIRGAALALAAAALVALAGAAGSRRRREIGREETR